MALKAEEKLSRNQGQRGQGRSQPKGKSVAQDKTRSPRTTGKSLRLAQREVEVHSDGKYVEPRGQHNEQRGGYADNNIFLVLEVEEEEEVE
jgi:hypothetical protein